MHCEVCGKHSSLVESISEFSSMLGKRIFFYCNVCTDQWAEPLWYVQAYVQSALNGNINKLPDEFKNLKTFSQGKYILIRNLCYNNNYQEEQHDLNNSSKNIKQRNW